MQTLLLLIDILLGGVLRRIRILVPIVLFLIFLALDASALGLGRGIAFLPDLAFATVLFWMIRHPNIMPIPLVFAIGFWTDAMNGSHLGLSIIAYLTVFYMIGSLRAEVEGSGFMFHWGAAVTGIAAYFTVQWVFYSAYELEVTAPFQNMVRAGMTALVYPLVYVLNNTLRSFLWRGALQLEDRYVDGA